MRLAEFLIFATRGFLLFTLGLTASPSAFGAAEVAFQKVWTLPVPTETSTMDISIYWDAESSWTESEIKNRLLKMNEALLSCSLSVKHVYVFDLKLSSTKVRVDDMSSEIFYDGIREIGKKSLGVTPVQLFYFEDYLEPFSSIGSLPFAIDSENLYVPKYLHNTIWIPFKSPSQVYNRPWTYSIEAHELGHVFRRAGHDPSGLENIMADSSKLRNNIFLKNHCLEFVVPVRKPELSSCTQLENQLYPTFATHYYTYGINYYMSLYCVRNSKNVFEQLALLFPEKINQIYSVLMIHKNSNTSISPLASRENLKSWSNHGVLLIDGLIVDLDYTKTPTILNAAEYLKSMWGDEVKNMLFQVRPATNMTDFTNLEIHASFKNSDYAVYTYDQWIKTLVPLPCSGQINF